MRSLTLAASLLLTPLAAAQSVHHYLTPPSPSDSTDEGLGTAVAGLEDVDGDGVPDFAVASPRPVQGDPCVRVYSGADRRTLVSFDLGQVDGTGVCMDELYDIDGDGISELLVGLPLADGGNGRVLLFSLRTGELLRTHTGAGGERLGTSVAGFNDVNFDGKADYAIGAPRNGPHDHGAVFVYSGDDAWLIDTQLGTASAQGLGHDVDYVGDFDGNLLVDLVASGIGTSTAQGAVVVFTPVTSELLLDFPSSIESWGTTVVGLGDIAGDGRADFAVGAPLYDAVNPATGATVVNSGLVYLVAGGTSGGSWTVTGGLLEHLGSDLARTWLPGGPNWIVAAADDSVKLLAGDDGHVLDEWTPASIDLLELGKNKVRVDGLGDLDSDGLPEILVGAPLADSSGTDTGLAVVYRGSGAKLLDVAPRREQAVESSVALLGDVDGDGLAETAVGMPHDDSGAYDGGSVSVRSGADGSELWRLEGPTGAQLGFALASLPDLDGDGVADLAIGQPWAYSGTFQTGIDRTGSVRVVSGADGTGIVTIGGQAAGERFGAALTTILDQTGDGREDLVVGAPDFHKGAQVGNHGRVAVHASSAGSQLASIDGPAAGARFGTAVAALDAGPSTVDPILAITSQGSARVTVRYLGSGQVLWEALGSSEVGTALAAVPDRDGDGMEDLLIGDPGGAAGAGEVRFNSTLTIANLGYWVGSYVGEHLGAAVAVVGDVDLDGVVDLAAGAPGFDDFSVFPPVVNLGRVSILSGQAPHAELRRWTGVSQSEALGSAIAAGADIDADGLGDLAATAPGWLSGRGRAWTLDPRAVSTWDFGSGTEGCGGPQRLIAVAPPVLGSVLELRADGGPAGTLVYLALSLGADVPGTDWGLGFLVHWDLGLQFLLTSGVTDGAGRLTFPTPVPAAPVLAGLDVYAQTVFSQVPAPCPQLPQNLSASPGLHLRLLP
ncbi:integrin alpha [Engelhardtia mirabilis]|uniref:FG-GAP repeat protein n=1 Tax=Engelhardtia mirabilis TaxID=2528011 RepID=A0A518BRA8_9BACT|nr:FG-GAP repeat protein [Planctomycetes bacterium Pla133]QDV03834.1 FG-GAP repeat protein [Planctomycetes bacterium Pla86]